MLNTGLGSSVSTTYRNSVLDKAIEVARIMRELYDEGVFSARDGAVHVTRELFDRIPHGVTVARWGVGGFEYQLIKTYKGHTVYALSEKHPDCCPTCGRV